MVISEESRLSSHTLISGSETLGTPDKATNEFNLKKGDVDSSGNEVKRIFSKEPLKYVIYETMDDEVKIKGTNVSLANHARISNLLSQIGDLITHSHSLRIKYNSTIAHAMKVLLDGDSEASYASLLTTFKDMKRFLSRGAKFSYLSGAAFLMIFSFIVFIIAYIFGLSDSLTARIFYAVIFSSMGGFLSVAIGIRSLRLDLQDGHTINIGYGALRILIAIISGVITLFLIEYKIILPFLRDAPENHGFVIATFISGFSEKLVPNLLSKIEDTSDKEAKE